MVKKGSEAECHLLSSTDAVASVVSHDNRNELNHWFIFHDYLDKTLFAFSIYYQALNLPCLNADISNLQ